MTQTLRREIINAITKRLDTYLEEQKGIIDWSTIYDIAADAALEVRGMARIGTQNRIFADLPVSEADLRIEQIKDEASKAFESALEIEQSWPWWTSRKWTTFSTWVVTKYNNDNGCFEKYGKWRKKEFVRGALSNGAIYGDAGERLMAAGWSDFISSAEVKQETESEYPTL